LEGLIRRNRNQPVWLAVKDVRDGHARLLSPIAKAGPDPADQRKS
jgi:hypothetical protein